MAAAGDWNEQAKVAQARADGPWPGLRFDMHLPPTPAPPGGHALLVWIHWGAWMSGRKEDVANYLRIVAACGRLATASLGIDPQRIVLAGDSAGAQLAAQLAAAITDPAYGARLGVPAGGVDPGAIRGTALFCGPFDLALFRLDGPLGPVLRALGVRVQTLYFPDDHTPPLGHEYQFTLDEPAGEMALQRLLGFLAERLR